MATTTEEVRPGAAETEHEPDPRRWISLAVVLCASFMVLIDISIVNVAIPTMQRSLGISYSGIQWVLAGYQLAYGVLLITGGRLGDIAGRKRMFIIGVSGFTIASALCGFARNGGMLIASRVLQGGFAAMMYPQVFSVVQVAFPPRERAKAFGTAGAVIGVASITGPLAGGLLVHLDWFDGWRPVFLVNLPIGIGAVIAAIFFLHESRSPNAPRVDVGGVVLASMALLAILYPVVEGRDAGWPWWTFALMAASLLIFAAFWQFERRRARTSGSPLVEPALFRDRAFVVGVLIAALFFAGIPAFFLTFSLFVQIGLGFSALAAGATTLPFAIGSGVASGVSIRLVATLGKRLLQIGTAVLIAGTIGVGLTVHAEGHSLLAWSLAPSLLVAGIGLGLTVAPLFNVLLAGVDRRIAGSASGVLTTMQQVGGAAGVAVIGVIFFNLIGGHADTVAQASLPQLRAQLQAAQVPAAVQDRIATGYTTCFHDRANESDPSVVPPSCVEGQPQAARSPAGPGLQRLAAQDLGDDFSFGMWASLGFELVVWAVTFLLVFALPRVDLGHRPPMAPAEG